MMTRKVSKTSVKASLLKIRRLAVALVFLFAAQGVWGYTYSWTGNSGNGEWNTPGNWNSTDGGTTYPTTGDTAYITGNVTINDARALGSIYVRDNTTITVNAAVTATFLSMEPTGQDYVTDDFNVKITGTGSLTVDNGGADNSNAIILSRWSSTEGKIGTLEIDTTVECKQRIETHSGTQLLVNSGKTLKTKYLVHKATDNKPITKISIAGNLEVYNQLDLGEIQGSAELNNSGTIITNTITSTNAAYNNTGSKYLINNTGTIKVSSSFTIPAFTNTSDFTPYKGTGSIVLNGTNASFTNNDDVDISITTLQGLQSSVVSGGGHTTIVTADFDAAVQLNGITITTADFAGAAQLGNTASNTIENATFHDDITLSGANAFTSVTATGLGNHTLTVNAVQTIQDDGSVSLSGTDNSSRLTVTGNGTGNFALGSIMLNGNYLSLDTTSNVVTNLNGTAFAQNTVTTGSGSSNWIVTAAAEHVWSGGTDGAWETPENWLPPSVPLASDDVIINEGSPQINSDVTVNKITINGSGPVTVNNSKSLTISTGCELDDKIEGEGTLVLASGQTYTVSSAKDFNINLQNNGTLNATAAMIFEKDFTNNGTATTSADITVKGVNWTNNGTFTASAGTVTFTTTSNTDTAFVEVKGDNTFYDVEFQRNAEIYGSNVVHNFTANKKNPDDSKRMGGRNIYIAEGKTLKVNGNLNLQGNSNTSGNRFRISCFDPDHSTYQWNLNWTGSGTNTIRYVSIKGCKLTGNSLVLENCTDFGGNEGWLFLNQTYEWTGASGTTDWNTPANWSPASIPGKGADVIIAEVTSPAQTLLLADALDLRITHNGTDYNGKITVNSGAVFDLAGNNLSVGTITNNGLVRLTGATGASTQTITAVMENGTGSTVEYYGTGAATTNFAWDGSSDAGMQYNNLIINNDTTITGDLVIAGKFTVNNNTNVTGSITVTKNSEINCTQLTVSGNQTYNNAVTLGTANGHTLSGTEITFGTNATINGGAALTLSGSTNNTLNANVGGTDPLTSLTVTGPLSLNCAEVKTSTTQEYQKAVTLGTANAHILSGTEITFGTNATIKGGAGLTLSGTLDNIINADVGDDTALSLLSVTGPAHINCSQIKTTGEQSYSGAVTIGSTTELTSTGGNIGFTSTVSGDTLKINQSVNTSFNGAVNLTSLADTAAAGNITFKAGGSISSATTLNTSGNISLTGTLETASLVLNNLVVDGNAVITTNGSQTYNGTINGKTAATDTLTLNSNSNQISFGSNIGQNLALSTLTVNGPAQIACPLITTSGSQTYKNTVNLAQAVTFTAKNGGTKSSLEFDGPVSGTSAAATSLTVDADTIIKTASITTNDNQIYKGSVSIQTDTELTSTGGDISFNSTLDGAYQISLQVPDNKTISVVGQVGNSVAPAVKIIQAQSTTFDGAVMLTKFEDTATAGNIAFNNGGTISDVVSLVTPGTVSFNNSKTFTFADGDTKKSFTHTNGDTTLVGSINASQVSVNNLALKGTITTTTNGIEISGTTTVNGNSELQAPEGQSVHFADAVAGAQNAEGQNQYSLETKLADVTFDSTVSKFTSLKTAGTATFSGNVTDVNTLTTSAAQINCSQITSSGAQNYSGAVTIGTSTELTSGGTIGFTSTVSGATLKIIQSGGTSFNGAVNLTSLADTAAAGNISLNAGGTISNEVSLNTPGTVSFTGTDAVPMKIGQGTPDYADLTHTAGPTNITGTLNAAAINLGTSSTNKLATITNGKITASSISTAALTVAGADTTEISTTGTQVYNGAVNGTALKIVQSSGTSFNGTVTLTKLEDMPDAGNISFNENTTIKSDTTFNTRGTVSFNNSKNFTFADGDTKKSFTHITGDTNISGKISASSTQIKDITLTGNSEITTTGTQSFTGTIDDSTDGAHTLTLNSNSSQITFGDDIGQTAALSLLSVTGPVQMDCSKITTTGAQSYTGAVIIGSTTELTSGGTIGFASTVSGDTLKINQSNGTTFTGAVTLTKFEDMTNAGNISFNENTTIKSDTTFNTRGTVSFNNSKNFTFADDGGTKKSVTHITGDTNISGTISASSTQIKNITLTGNSEITTTGTQSFTGTIDDSTDGAHTLTLNSNSSQITFGDDIGQTAALSLLSVTGPVQMDCGKIKTTGAQSYNGAVTIATTELTSTGGNISFTSTVDGNTLKINQSNGTTFTGTVTLTKFEDTTTAGNIAFNNGGTISNEVSLNTPGTVSFTGTDAVPMKIGQGTPDYADLTHTAGPTNITGTLNAAAINLGTSSTNKLATITNGKITASSISTAALTVAGADTTEISTTGTQVYNGAVNGTALKIVQSSGTSFNGTVTLTKLEDMPDAGNISFNENTTIKSDTTFNTRGTVSFNNSKTFAFADDGGTKKSVTHITGDTNISGTISASSTQIKNITLTGNSEITTTGTQSFTGTIDDSTDGAHTLTLNSNSSQITFGDDIGQTAALSLLSVTGPVQMNCSKITTTGAQSYNGAVTIATTELTSTGGNISFTSTVDGNTLKINQSVSTCFDGAVTLTSLTDTASAGNININAGGRITNDVAFATEGTVTLKGTDTAPLNFTGSLTHNTYNTVIDGTINAQSLTVGPLTAKGKVTTADTQNYNGAVTLNDALTLKSDAAAAGGITFASAATINEAQSLAVITKNGSNGASFNADIGATTDLASLTVTGPAQINCAQITTSGNQTYNDALTLGISPSATHTLSANQITFQNAATIDGAADLTLSGTTNNIVKADVGATTPLNALTITGPAQINCAQIITNGNQTYKAAVRVLQDTTLTAAATKLIKFESTLAGDAGTESLTTADGDSEFDGTITNLAALTTDATATFNANIRIGSLQTQAVNINCAQITTDTTQEYQKAVTLGTSISETHTLSGSQITFQTDAAIDGAAFLILSGTTNNILKADVGATTPLTALTITGPAQINCAQIKTSENQTYKAAVSLSHDTTLTAAATKLIKFESTLTGATGTESLTTADGNCEFNGEVTNLAALTTDATATFNANINSGSLQTQVANINCAQITTNGAQEYNGAFNLVSNSKLVSQLTGASGIVFNSSVNGNQSLRLEAENSDIVFAGVVGNTVPPALIELQKAQNVHFNDAVKITTLTDSTQVGDINFNAGGSITAAGGQTFRTLQQVSFGNDSNDAFVIGTAESPKALVHTAGATSITGSLTAAAITLAQTSGGPMTINNSGLFTTTDGSALTYTTSFVQNGTGNSILGGSFGGTGNASFATNVQAYGSSAADFGAPATNINIGKNLIILRDAAATDELDILSNVNATENIVLYKGAVTLSANMAAGKDILILGSDYSTTDTTTGITDEYAYLCARPATWSQPNYNEELLPDGTAVPGSLSGPSTGSGTTGTGAGTFTSTLAVAPDKTISAGKNFYANGTELSAAGAPGQWILKLPDLTNAATAFAEAYFTQIAGCKVICSDDTSSDATKARLICLECDDNGNNAASVDFDDFEITTAWTERDNAIRVEFNRPVRYHAASVANLKFQKADGSPTAAFTGLYSDPDCQTEINYDTQLSYFYIKAAPQEAAALQNLPGAWNTDATGKSSGAADALSTDRSGIHHQTKPVLDFPRALTQGTATLPFILTDRWGKRLNNYSQRVTKAAAAQSAYGSTDDSTNEVLDKTGPVLYRVRTGQELHTPYDPALGQAGEHSYDSHNFIEFLYSEKVDFNGSDDDDALNLTAAASVENIQVTDALGALTNSDITRQGSLSIAGLGIIQNGLFYTGRNARPDKYVNALYRTGGLAEYSVRLSLAGYTDPSQVVTDADNYTYKKWLGYIENAVLPTGSVTHLVDPSTKENARVKDKAGNAQIKYADHKTNGQAVFDTIPEIDNSEEGLYGGWDLSAPVFAPVRAKKSTAWISRLFLRNYAAEAVGNNSGVGSTLDRIEFHLFDNTPEFDTEGNPVTGSPEWFTEAGWCNQNSDGEKARDLFQSYTYAADIFGGARPFDSDSQRRTSGGIRYSTLYSSISAFKYGIGTNLQDRFITTSFDTSKAVIAGASSLIFTGSSAPRRSAGNQEGLYFALPLANTSLDIKTSFTVKYDDTVGAITDLAGNRLRTKTFSTIDRTPPSIDMTVCPVGGDEMEIIFVKELCTESKDLHFVDNSGDVISITEPFDVLVNKCFDFITIDSSGQAIVSDLKIKEDVPAQISIVPNPDENPSGPFFTKIHFKLSRTVTLEDIKNTYIRVTCIGPEWEYSTDKFTGHPGARVSLIQDANETGNNIQMYTAHALSDFAVGIINPLYAYDSAMTEEDGTIISDSLLHKNLTDDVDPTSWAVHDWNRDQQNYGSLPAKRPVAIVADTSDGTEENENPPIFFRLYAANSPDPASLSTQYNKDLEPDTPWRIWLPDATSLVFTSLAEKNNTNYSRVDGSLLSDQKSNRLIFDLDQTIVNQWSAGNQISFLFGLTNSDGSPVTIMHAPELDINRDKQYLPGSAKMPLFALRQTDPADLLSLDLWSFRLKDLLSQRGRVTILNNVINASVQEKAVVKVDLPQDGNLTVMVMTLDGNIIDYLHRGSAQSGEHFFSWDGSNRSGKPVARGMYFIRVTGPGLDETRKVMVIKE